MPTPRSHGGAPLASIPLVGPGFFGLNKESDAVLLGPEWATILSNTVIDDSGRVAARKGFSNITTTPVVDDFVQTHEYFNADGTVIQVSSSDTAIYSGTTSFTDVTNTVTPLAGNWQFLNFYNKVVGVQEGHHPIVWDGTGGGFADIVDDGFIAEGNCGTAAFGRLWIADDDGTTLRYSSLLDETIWDPADVSGDAGLIDMNNVWVKNQDVIVAVIAHNNLLVVFGKEQIIIWEDGSGSTLGIDPSQMYVRDTISSMGCVSRDTVQNVKGDLWFLSDDGMQSLGRLIQEKSAPINSLCPQVQDYLLDYIADARINDELDTLRSVYSPTERFFLLSLPTRGVAFCFDTRRKLQDGSARCVGVWTLAPTALAFTRDNDVVMARSATEGALGTYSGYVDDEDSYGFTYESGWLNLGEDFAEYLKILKRAGVLISVPAQVSIRFKWAWDFEDRFTKRVKVFQPDGVSEYNEVEWDAGSNPGNSGEWSGGLSLKNLRVPASGTGQYIKVGVETDISGAALAIQQIDLTGKIGRQI